MHNLSTSLDNYINDSYYPFHMPGHKRTHPLGKVSSAFDYDITEIYGFDDLHKPTGLLLDIEKHAASLYHVKKSFLTVGGSTCGILSAISYAISNGGSIIMAVNCHKSAYHTLYLRDASCEYVYPSVSNLLLWGSITTDSIKEALIKNPSATSVFITSPTYEGVVSDIAAIADIVHAHGKLLIVDEAHGAHFGFHEDFPKSAALLGADIVIQSMHKTLPAYTQTALVHINTDSVDPEKFALFLDIYQTSSPSYVFMTAACECLDLLSFKGYEMFGKLSAMLDKFYSQCSNFKYIKFFGSDEDCVFNKDKSKIVFYDSSHTYNGNDLYNILREQYKLEMEMYQGNFVTALCSICDIQEGFDRLFNALKNIDNTITPLDQSDNKGRRLLELCLEPNKHATSIRQAIDSLSKDVLIESSNGCICSQFVMLYPPGIPFLKPGDIISKRHIDIIKLSLSMNHTVYGLTHNDQKIKVLRCQNG